MRRPLVLIGFLLLYTLLMQAVAMLVVSVAFDWRAGWADTWSLLATPSSWEFNFEWWFFAGGPALALVASQALFLWPVLRQRPELSASGKPLSGTIIVAGLVAAVLTVALAAALADLIAVLATQRPPEDVHSDLSDAVMADSDLMIYLPYSLLGVSWLIWSLLLVIFTRRHTRQSPPTRLERWVGLLLGATIAELLVVIPIDLMVRRRTECYCATGSFVAICFSAWALLWLAGPGAVLALTSKRRRLLRETRCPSCGHEKGPTPGEHCPECSAAWSCG